MNEKKKPVLGQEAVTDARVLGAPRMLVLGLQHLFAMFGATVLVPILVQGYGLPLSIQTTLLMAGLGTLLFHVCTKFKVPAFLGSSFAYLGGFSTVASMPAYEGFDPELKLAYALGGIVIAGLLYLVLALLFKVLGAKTVMRYFPPIVTGPMIIMIGLNLSGSAITNAQTCWWLALVAMAIIVVANIWGKGMVKIIPILLGVVGSYLVAVIATFCGAELPDANGVMQPLVNFTAVSEAHLVGLQKFILAKDVKIRQSAALCAVFDTSAALLAMLIIIPAMATVGADLGNGGPGLMFIYLLPVFNGLGAGISRVICIFFYLVVLFAGVSSIINLFETPVAFLQEKLNLKRLPATAVIHVLGVLIALMIQPWTSQWMDMVSIYLCPLGAFTAGVMFFWVMKKDTALEAAQLGDSKPLMKWFYPFGRYVFVPLCLLCFVLGIAMGGIG